MSKYINKNFQINIPTTVVIFGVTGDLSQQKLLPAIFDLHQRGVLPTKFRLVGFSRRDLTQADFRKLVQDSLRTYRRGHDKKSVLDFMDKCSYQMGDFTKLADFQGLAHALNDADRDMDTCSNKLFHLAVSPHFYKPLLNNLAKSGLSIPCVPVRTKSGDIDKNSGWTRVLIEKPFGRDMYSAQKLDVFLSKLFAEDQIFRIDHYLAKQTVQNILAFRFSNGLFEPIWNNDHIERVEIELMEIKDVSNRINFYDGVGALRDVGQSHAMQLLSLIAMDEPSDMRADVIRKARAEIMKNLVLLNKKNIKNCAIRAQYDGYKKEQGVNSSSKTETYFQLRAELKNKRWKKVPFYITAGKALDKSKVKIKIYFKPSKMCFACNTTKQHEHPQNMLVFRVQPQEGIAVHFWAKKPGLGMELVKKELSFDYAEFDGHNDFLPNAYQTLLYDAMRGDQTNFASSEELKYSWKYITKILKLWDVAPLQTYKKGSGGPKNKLI
ncbi:glucose-6-phosphate dehydrogenase [Candidatus Falkowbacteria bacterium CG10_big_fil_rev_8_21_14_0_10_37_6]|uniref:Glucose-6-phosphate 1-dehydrogenase n=1 Tax=Candidatus Falkowbacteria bacterium CG10_big_fil_rev_8_21_14_0_10_37_6 TaxID=1974563 RepID=A0A2H0V8S4_9BACT|nr:MAG: glucose-6-phosphate dehydrogenase [Candidatus Falkowbacteria bacterium CG10_big_fil_rev_8_21_14_0_10_37_6]